MLILTAAAFLLALALFCAIPLAFALLARLLVTALIGRR